MKTRINSVFRTLTCVLASALLIVPLSSCSKKYVKLDDVDLANFQEAQVGEEIAVLTIEHANEYVGEIRIKLFPDIVPEAVDNFKALIENGYYDDCVFFYVQNDAYVMSGDKSGLGTGGEAAEEVYCVPSNSLCNFTGAVAFTSQSSLCDSRFYIVTGGTVTSEDFVNFAMQDSQKYFAQNVKAVYLDVGGQPGLDNESNMVFGQVFEEDLSILQKIDSVELGADNRPSKAVRITSAKIVEYDGK